MKASTMDNLARKIRSTPVSTDAGTVIRADGGGYEVRTDQGDWSARRATSCLVEPEPGDRVLLATVGREAFVLAVLERESTSVTLATDGPLTLRAREGRITLAAQDGVELASGKDVSLSAAEEVRVRAPAGNVVLDRLSYAGSLVAAEVTKVKVLAEQLDSVAARIWQRAKRVYRSVEELDSLKAEKADWSVKSTLSVHADNAVVTANELVKVDGEQIHIG